MTSLVVEEHLYPLIDQITARCTRLSKLRIGYKTYGFNLDGSIWDGNRSINDLVYPGAGFREEPGETADEDDEYELDVKLISRNLAELRSLEIGSGLQLARQPVAPPFLNELTLLEDLRICPLRQGVLCDRSRDEWNLRILAQSSVELRRIDLRGCYLKILSLGWLKTEKLEALHLYYQVPAASVLSRWSKQLRYVTLAKISTKYRTYRSMGPVSPAQELDACLMCLSVPDSELIQIDVHESDCSIEPLKTLIDRAKKLNYIDTLRCNTLHERYRVRLIERQQILNLFFNVD